MLYLLYASEYWTISNKDLPQKTNHDDMRTFLKVRRWRWIGYELKKNWTPITRTVVRWTPDGKWKKRDTGNNMAHDSRRRVKTTSTGWSTVEKAAKGPVAIEKSCYRPLRQWGLRG